MDATSIVVPCCGQLQVTRICLRALFGHTRSPLELILVDNGSNDGTGTYLAGIQDASPVPVTVIANQRNLASRPLSTKGSRRRMAITS